jgi:hypothetical protein
MRAPPRSPAAKNFRPRPDAVLPVIRLLVALLATGLAALSAAHDLITPASVEAYLARADADLATVRGKGAPRVRAESYHDLGRMLDEIRELLNRDVASHGRVQGLPTLLLLKELDKRGLALVPDRESGRFPAPVAQYQEALRLDPDVRGGDAAFRLLVGRFYDSFEADPLRPRLTVGQVEDQLRLAERLATRRPAHPEQEEIEFVMAVHHAQMVGLAADRTAAAEHARRVREAVSAFGRRYPDSLRNAALSVLTAGTRP